MGQTQMATLENNKSIKSGYEVPYLWYDIRGFFIFKLCYQDSLLSTVRFFAKNYSSQHLEVAAGSGSFMDLCLKWRLLSRKKASGVAFDYMPSMLKGAKDKFGKNPNWKIEAQDVTKMSYANNSFQTINVANAFHCFSDPEKAACELYRVLKPQGSLVVNIVTPPRGSKWKRNIAQRLIDWGKRTKILEDSIDYNRSIIIFENEGFRIDKVVWKGNNLRLRLLKK